MDEADDAKGEEPAAKRRKGRRGINKGRGKGEMSDEGTTVRTYRRDLQGSLIASKNPEE